MAEEPNRSETVVLDHDVLSTEVPEGIGSRQRSLSPFSRVILRDKMLKKLPLWKKIVRLVFVSCLGVLVILFTVVAHVLAPEDTPDSCVHKQSGTFLFNDRDGYFRLCHSGEERLKAHLGVNIINNQEKPADRGGGNRFTFTGSAVIWNLLLAPTETCVQIQWSGETSYRIPFKDCLRISDATWYSASETHNQLWPINSTRPMMPFLSNVTYKHPDGFGPVLHPMWLSSNGVLIYVDNAIPLHVSTNTTHLCLHSVPYALGCTPRAAQVGKLTYTVCQFSDIVEAAKHFLQNSGQVERPKMVPDVNVLKMPIWSTGIFLGRNVKENDTCGYINRVLAEKFPISKFGIDCCYSATYGELDIDSDRFPGGFQGISDIANNRFSLSAWVHPFVNYNFDAFEKALKGELGIFLPGGSKETTALVEWKLGHGALINFEMDEALQWYEGKLNEFVRNSHLNALHFYAGESEYLPDCLYFPDSTHPATYTQKYIQFVSNYSSQANLGAEMHVGYFSQNASMFLRMTERSSTWGLNNGLKSVITTALTLSLAGYNFLIPGIIGGNGTCSNSNFSASCTVSGNSCNSISLDCGATFCDNTTSQRELYIRWMQIATFLPVMHFSIPPWIFKDENLTSYARKLTKFHGSFVDMYILPILEKTVNTTMCPLIRPIWWLDPKSNVALHSDDQFMIGNTIMVAPITEPGVKSRDVYFPPGTWQRCHITDASEETCPSVFIDTKLADRHKQLTIQLLDTRGMVYFKRTAPAAENWC